MNHSLPTTSSILDHKFYLISNYCIEIEEIIDILDYKVEPIYYNLYLSYSFYLSMNLYIFNITIINMIHTSCYILVTLDPTFTIRIYQEKLSLFNTSKRFEFRLINSN